MRVGYVRRRFGDDLGQRSCLVGVHGDDPPSAGAHQPDAGAPLVGLLAFFMTLNYSVASGALFWESILINGKSSAS